MNVFDLKNRKKEKKKISMVTCYDFWSAQILNQSKIDLLLVGDSLSMVMHGHANTIPATLDIMALHTESVVRGAPDKFIVSDLPFLSYRKNLNSNMNAVERLMQSGCQAIKLEGRSGNEGFIRHVVESGVPVMGHLGLTPQSIYQLGGFKVQGRDTNAAQRLEDSALKLEDSGCFSLVLECVPAPLAEKITQRLSIPTIGIGAGPGTDGQVLVLHDLMGYNKNFKPKFVRQYAQGYQHLLEALNHFDEDVKQLNFPSVKESYE